MSALLEAIKALVASEHVLISNHGYDELSNDGILAREVLEGAKAATIVREYPEHGRGPCVLVLQRDGSGRPIHVVWGIPKNQAAPAVLVTAYRPDPKLWEADFLRRKL